MKKVLKLSSLLLVLVALLTLASCTPKDLDAAKDKLEKADYEVTVVEGTFADATFEAMGLKNVEGALMAASEDGKEYVAAYYFESKADAKEAMEKIEELMKEDAEEEEAEVEVKQSGKWIYAGTKQAMKDFA